MGQSCDSPSIAVSFIGVVLMNVMGAPGFACNTLPMDSMHLLQALFGNSCTVRGRLHCGQAQSFVHLNECGVLDVFDMNMVKVLYVGKESNLHCRVLPGYYRYTTHVLFLHSEKESNLYTRVWKPLYYRYTT